MPDVTSSREPELSAIVIAPDGWEPVATTVRHLAAQTIADRMEIVFVVPRRVAFAPDPAVTAALAAIRLATVDDLTTTGAAYGAGVRAAAAPYVVFCEDHCFPEPGWAAALLAAYDERTAVAGPVVVHANDAGAIAWADYLLGYGQWAGARAGEEVTNLPGHNSSYRRDLLLEVEPHLDRWLDAEYLLHFELRRRGWRLVLVPEARSHHYSISRPASWLLVTYLQYRMFGGRRLAGASLPKRAFYAAAAPLVPAIRLRRLARDVRRAGAIGATVRALPAIGLALGVGALGEAMGYAFGPGDAPRRIRPYESRRDLHVNERDRRAIARSARNVGGAPAD